jgi:hypothetical protein
MNSDACAKLFSRLHKNVAGQGWVYFRTEQIDILDAAVLRKFASMYGLCHFPYREGVYLPRAMPAAL